MLKLIIIMFETHKVKVVYQNKQRNEEECPKKLNIKKYFYPFE